MTTIEQAKEDRDFHWDNCEECVPPVLSCYLGTGLHDAYMAALRAAQAGPAA